MTASPTLPTAAPTSGDRGPIWNPEAECQSDADVRQNAGAALTAIVERLASSPFHARQFASGGVSPADIRSIDDIVRIPFSEKDQLRSAQEQVIPFGDYLAADLSDVKCVYQTSGTTGTPALIALTRADIETWTEVGARSYWAAGIRPHNSVLSTFGAGPFVAGASHRVLDRLGCRMVPVGPGDTERVLSALRKGLADTLLGTPTFALHLLDRSTRAGDDPASLGLRRILTGGEPGGGLPAVRASLEQGFGAQVVEVMGIGDITPSLFGETPDQAGMHFCGQGAVWPELVDTDGSPVAIEPGVRGELVLTSLRREAMPMLRMRTHDIVEILGVGDRFGRTSFRMRCVGRTDDLIIVRGVNVFPSAVQAVVGGFRPRVTGRSCIVVEGQSVTIDPPIHTLVEVADDAPIDDPELAAAIEYEIRDRLVVRARVEFVPQSTFGPAGYKTRGLERRPPRTPATESGI